MLRNLNQAKRKCPLDPEAAGNAAQYLRLPEIALCEVRYVSFIGAYVRPRTLELVKWKLTFVHIDSHYGP